MNRPNHCVYCLLRVDNTENFLHCRDCDKDVHIGCLKRPGTPGDIIGDVFFDFRCSHCTDDGREQFDRQHLPWAMMVVLTLHNLGVQSRGLSHHGFFHWRTHIACFIERNWEHLIGSTVKKKKKWIGTISGTLSHNTPVMFRSGFNVFKEQGWWKLSHNLNPKQYMEFYNTQRMEQMKKDRLTNVAAMASASGSAAPAQMIGAPAAAAVVPSVMTASGRQQTAAMAAAVAASLESSVEDVDVDGDYDSGGMSSAKRFRAVDAQTELFSRTIPFMGRTPWKLKQKEQNTVEADLAAFLSSNISNVDLNLDLSHIAGLTDDTTCVANSQPLHATSSQQSIGIGPAGSPMIPSSNNVGMAANEWPDALLDLDFLKSVDMMAQFEGGSVVGGGSQSGSCSTSIASLKVRQHLSPDLSTQSPRPSKPKRRRSRSKLKKHRHRNKMTKPTVDANSVAAAASGREVDDKDADGDDIGAGHRDMFEPRVVQVTNFQTGERDYLEDVTDMPDDICVASDVIKSEPLDEHHNESVAGRNIARNEIAHANDDDDEDADDEHDAAGVDYDTKFVCAASRFTRNTNDSRQPWLNEEQSELPAEDDGCGGAQDGLTVEKMSVYEEAEMLRKLTHIVRASDRRETANMPTWLKRFYRKLCVRQLKRQLRRPLFDMDELLLADRKTASGVSDPSRGGGRLKYEQEQVLDRYHQQLLVGSGGAAGDRRRGNLASSRAESALASEHSMRLAGGSADLEMFVSPHTGRMLHPYVYRNAEQMPPWVKLMSELQYAVNGSMPTRSTIDYCYVRPHHIAAVNGLLQKTFWPGIDMSECLSYPEFSIVALYKRLLVGCAFLVPDVGHNDAYVSFMAVRPGWQRAGLAAFMLYHLTQTCMGKDITLHVSATNANAICLYQKFGFKMEEVLLDFYEKYLPADSPHSRHAFFLRLKR